jgi:CHAD domain-containing protein
MTTHTEIERKYEGEPGAKLPALDQLSGVAEVSPPAPTKLEATYFDTADLRLLRNGVTLRRRTGGSDAGWHLKLPAGNDTREELREPLDRAEGDREQPPDALRRLTVGLSRGTALRPVARVVTDRVTQELLGRNGKVLAEVTDDTVAASTLTGPSTTDEWHEVEVELADSGDVEVLDRVEKFLRRAGFHRSSTRAKVAKVLPLDPPARVTTTGTAGDVVFDYLSSQVSAILRHDLNVRRDADDAVHQLRVAIRRLRSALRVFGRIVDSSRTSALADELRWLGRRLSPARDLEVQEAHFREEVAALPDELVLGPVAARLTRHFSPTLAEARRTVRETLDSERYRELLDELDRLSSAPPLTRRARRPARKELPKHIRRAYRKTVRRMDAVPSGEGHDRELHRARKAAKRFRYGLECVEPVIGKKAKRSRKNAKALTKLLGEHQDAVVARPMLRELGARVHTAGENGFTFGVLLEREHERAREAERELPAMWKTFTTRKTRAWFS